eukprot:4041897-Amphidinium_carterae.1
MPKLTSLICYINQLSGSLPTEGFKGKQIRILVTFQNAMSGSLPDEGLRAGQWWVVVRVNGNHHTGSIPCFILRDSKNLWFFAITLNHFTGMLCEGIRHMTKVRTFKVAYNQLAGSLCGGWRRPKLEKFVLSANRFSGTLIEAGATKLQIWMVDTNSFSGTLPDAILKTLELA